MPKAPLTEQAAELLSRPNPAVMATIHPDGYPVTVATWYSYQDGQLLLNLDGRRARLRHLQANPSVSLAAIAEDDWYTHISVQGHVIEVRDDVDLVDIDRLSHRYSGTPYSDRQSPRVSVVVQIDRWHGWGAVKR